MKNIKFLMKNIEFWKQYTVYSSSWKQNSVSNFQKIRSVGSKTNTRIFMKNFEVLEAEVRLEFSRNIEFCKLYSIWILMKSSELYKAYLSVEFLWKVSRFLKQKFSSRIFVKKLNFSQENSVLNSEPHLSLNCSWKASRFRNQNSVSNY